MDTTTQDITPTESPGRSQAAPTEASRGLGHCNTLLLSFLSFFVIGFGVWVIFAGSRYRQEYADSVEGWHMGSTRTVELSIVREDQHNLECAADPVVAGLRCSHRHDLQEAGPASPDKSEILQPYNTVGNELLLGAGLWSSPDMKGPMPEGRLTVVCNYHIKGVLKSAMIRFSPTAPFGPVGRTITLGTFTDCMIPR